MARVVIGNSDGRGSHRHVRYLGRVGVSATAASCRAPVLRVAMTAFGLFSIVGAAQASEPGDAPAFSVALRETADVWDVTSGDDPGLSVLNKLQV